LPLRAALAATVSHDRLDVTVSKRRLKPEEVDNTLKDHRALELPIVFEFQRGQGSVNITLREVFSILLVEITPDSDETKHIHELVRDTLVLKTPTQEDVRTFATLPHINELLWTIHDKLDRLADSAHPFGATTALRCFISFRFDDHSKALALELRELLELVDVEFVSGLGFEPRSVSEKVLARLAGHLDLFVIIHSSQGDSAWLNQEVGVARSRSLPIVVLREGDAPYDSGMLGDTEYIQFPSNAISKAFVPLLQAIRFVRDARKRGA